MLLVNARAGMSKIHGIGLIAQEFIPAGTRIWEFREGFDLKLTLEQVKALSPVSRAQVLWYAFRDIQNQVFVLSMDDDRFTNHADHPNTIDVAFPTYASIATSGIEAGQEITWDYRPWGGFDHQLHPGELFLK